MWICPEKGFPQKLWLISNHVRMISWGFSVQKWKIYLKLWGKWWFRLDLWWNGHLWHLFFDNREWSGDWATSPAGEQPGGWTTSPTRSVMKTGTSAQSTSIHLTFKSWKSGHRAREARPEGIHQGSLSPKKWGLEIKCQDLNLQLYTYQLDFYYV